MVQSRMRRVLSITLFVQRTGELFTDQNQSDWPNEVTNLTQNVAVDEPDIRLPARIMLLVLIHVDTDSSQMPSGRVR